MINATDTSFTFTGSHHDHGGFATTPPAAISPRSAGAFGSQSRSGSLFTGTEGWSSYVGSGLNVKFYWDNPWIGGNSSDTTLESGDPTHFLTWSVTGAGDQKAEMQFVVCQRPFQDAWRFCHKCFSMFFDGYPTKGVCPQGGGHEAQGYNFVLDHH